MLVPKAPPPPLTPEQEKAKRIFMQDPDWDRIALYFVGSQQKFRENIIIPRALGGGTIKSNEEKRIESFMESCFFKSLANTVIGMKHIYHDT